MQKQRTQIVYQILKKGFPSIQDVFEVQIKNRVIESFSM